MSRPRAARAGTLALSAILPVILILILTATLTACDPGAAVDPDTARSALEQQRTDVRDLVAGLATAAAGRLEGRVSNARGSYRGCTSVFPEGHRDFRYVASARIDAGAGATMPLLTPLESVLRQAGLDPTPGERPGGRTLRARDGELEAAFSELPAQGRYVLLDVSGPCVEVPADQRDEWEGFTDPDPIVGSGG